jgi:hypothetical protein
LPEGGAAPSGAFIRENDVVSVHDLVAHMASNPLCDLLTVPTRE